MFEKTKAFCDSLLNCGLPGFDLAVYRKGQCVLRYIKGYSDLENRVEMTGNERYNIYSCSKVITCVAAMQLYEKGLFSLEDALSDYMPEFASMTVGTKGKISEAKNPIRIRHLFEMTAGFSYNLNSMRIRECIADTEGKCPTRVTMQYLAKEPLLFEPGERWEYSLCHDVLAALVEVISGEKFEVYVKKHIFDVVGMAHSTFMLPENELDTLAEQYVYKNGKLVNIGKNIDPYKIGSEFASGGAGCVSTVEDYIKFLEALRVGDVILKKETIAMMATDYLTDQQRAMYTYGTTNIGYGLGLRAPRKDAIHREFGWAGAAGAYASVDPELNISFYYAQHVISPPNRPLRRWLYNTIRADLLGEKVEVPIAMIDTNPELTY